MKKIRVMSIITTICIMALIFFFSSQTREESSEVSMGLVKKILNEIAGLISCDENVKNKIVQMMHGFIRTFAHFFIFLLLGSSSIVMFWSNMKKTKRTTGFIALIFCFIYACSDEIHQIFVKGRAFQLSDIFVDTSGAACGIFMVFLIGKIYVGLKRKGCKI